MELIPRSSDIDAFVNAVARDIGELPKLITLEKGNLVDAINEIALRHVDIVKDTEYNVKIAELEARLDALEANP